MDIGYIDYTGCQELLTSKAFGFDVRQIVKDSASFKWNCKRTSNTYYARESKASRNELKTDRPHNDQQIDL